MMTSQQQRELEEYLQHYCPVGSRAVQRGRRAAALPHLTAVDKAAIYYYTDDGYEALNRGLHASGGHNTSLFGQGLLAALAKLPPYEGEASSSVFLDPRQLQQYRARARDRQPISWPAFLSASKRASYALQYMHAEKNCLFVIQSQTGRLIEEISKFGVDGQNEYEILFAPNTQFEVLGVTKETGYTRIVLDEL